MTFCSRGSHSLYQSVTYIQYSPIRPSISSTILHRLPPIGGVIGGVVIACESGRSREAMGMEDYAARYQRSRIKIETGRAARMLRRAYYDGVLPIPE